MTHARQLLTVICVVMPFVSYRSAASPPPAGDWVGSGQTRARLLPHSDPLGGEHFFVDVPLSVVKPWTCEDRNVLLAGAIRTILFSQLDIQSHLNPAESACDPVAERILMNMLAR